jgi:hypothetical protein
LNLPIAIDRMDATVAASVRAVRDLAAGVASLSGKGYLNPSATEIRKTFKAPTEAVSAGLLS